ncbi:MAG TPA: TIGR01459 family HAD-type hydrolase [Sphingomicrobium sp.]|jgi:HAD superfamily hydrolase (TIGR01459 family)
MNFLDELPEHYRVILCDLWGCVHNGVQLYPGAADRLIRWRAEGRCVVLITNAPRTNDYVQRQVTELGLPRNAWDAITTGGEAGVEALSTLGTPVGFVGTRIDRAVLEERGIRIQEDEGFRHLACTGLNPDRLAVQDYAEDLGRWAANGVTMHCLNPDRVVVRGDALELCAGSLADAFEAAGGEVQWYGKPFPAIYEHALRLGGNPRKEQVLAIGDGLQTDVLGAALNGLDCVFVAGGIHGGGAFPEDFVQQHGLSGWRPVAVVPTLASTR